jgi:hypothetical protein
VIELQKDQFADSSEFRDGAFISGYCFSELEKIEDSNNNDDHDDIGFKSIDENIHLGEDGDSVLVSEY